MATSEYIPKRASSEKQPVGLISSVIPVRHRARGPAFASKLLLMLGDVFIVTLAFAFAIALKLRFLANLTGFRPFVPASAPIYFAFFGWFLLSLLLISRRYGLYNPEPLFSGGHEMRMTLQATFTAGLLLCGGLYLVRWDIASRAVVILLICTTGISLCLWRVILRMARYRNYEKGIDTRRVVILGTNFLSRALGEHLTFNHRLGYQFLGYMAAHSAERRLEIDPAQLLGDMEHIAEFARMHFIDEVVIAQSVPAEQVITLIEEARGLGVDIRAISGLYGDLAAHGGIEYLGVYPVTPLHRTRSRAFELFFKRIFDILFSTVALMAAFPVMVVTALAVRLDSEGPIFYVSERIGKRGRVFPCFKFRTMVKDAEQKKNDLSELNERDGILFKVSNDPRITRTGRILRKYSLDELPQFFNVLRGEMSLVGPRPPIASEVAKYELEHLRRLEVMPGLTGLWQVQARQDSSFSKYIELDTAYVEQWSFWLDLKILLRTAFVVVRGTGT